MKNHQQTCSCGQWKAKVSVLTPLEELNPRICDCSYCQIHPSAVVSDPSMVITLVGGKTKIKKNGDELASFYHCNFCGDFLAVGCEVNGMLRGAMNSTLLGYSSKLGKTLNIQPRFLSGKEKLERWASLWGILNVETKNKSN